MKRTYEITVRGRVQGVGFRWFVHKQATRTAVTGYVKNLMNGDVLILAQGNELNINTLVEIIRNGHPYARVQELTLTELSSATEYKDFQIA